MDAIALQKNGFKGAVAGLGTALTPEQCVLIKSYTDKVILLYDDDDAGHAATIAAISEFDAVGISPMIARMRDAKDADEYLNKYSPKEFQLEILDKALNTKNYMYEYNCMKYKNEPKKAFELNLNIVIEQLLTK